MGLFRRKKKADYDRGLLPSSDSFWNNFSESSTRQEEGGTKINIHETSPIMSKGSGSLPKPTVGIINDILLEEKIIQTSDKARSLIDGGKYQEALEFCEKIISTNFFGRNDSDYLDIWLQKSSAYFNLKRHEESNECEDVVLRLIQEKNKTDKNFFNKPIAWYSSLSLHTKATNYYFLNRPMEAKKCLLEVLEFDPINEVALEDLHDIEKKGGLAERVEMAEAQKKTEKNSSISHESENNFCKNCGKSLKPTAKFCGGCGTPRS